MCVYMRKYSKVQNLGQTPLAFRKDSPAIEEATGSDGPMHLSLQNQAALNGSKFSLVRLYVD